VTPAQHQIAGYPNHSGRRETNAGHFGGAAAMMLIVAIPIFTVNRYSERGKKER
jgi:hypothetical protein